MIKKLLFSFVVPVYNVERYLKRCIDSILVQVCDSFEVILVDDGSTDRSGALCDEFAAKDDRVSVIHKVNGGLADARNEGLKYVSGEYVIFVDSDDWIRPNMLSDLISIPNFLQQDVIVFGFEKIASENEVPLNNAPPQYEICTGMEALDRFVRNRINGQAWNKIVRAAIFDDPDIRYPVGRNYEDIPTTYKLFPAAKQVMLLDKVYYNYFMGNCDSITQNDTFKNLNDYCLSAEETCDGIRRIYKKAGKNCEWLDCFHIQLQIHLYIRTFYLMHSEKEPAYQLKVKKLHKHTAELLRSISPDMKKMKTYRNYKKYFLFRCHMLNLVLIGKYLMGKY